MKKTVNAMGKYFCVSSVLAISSGKILKGSKVKRIFENKGVKKNNI